MIEPKWSTNICAEYYQQQRYHSQHTSSLVEPARAVIYKAPCQDAYTLMEEK